MFAPHPSICNAWIYHSRADSQLTLITGKKFDPAPLESTIAASPWLNDVLIFGNGRPYPGALLFRADSYKTMTDDELIQSIAPLVERVNSESQSHARIPHNMLKPMPTDLFALEKSSKGTIIRNVAERKFGRLIDEVYSQLDTRHTRHISDENLPGYITKLVKSIVTSPASLKSDTDLFAYGMDSVACMQLRQGVRKVSETDPDILHLLTWRMQLIPESSKEIPFSIVEDCGTIDRSVDYSY